MLAFLSTPSARRATLAARTRMLKSRKISIHALREEGDVMFVQPAVIVLISIHALREEGDETFTSNSPFRAYFYPRPPRGGRHKMHKNEGVSAYFYPRPPRGGRRAARCAHPREARFLSTPSARRATLSGRAKPGRGGISIHALREEGDAVTLVQVIDHSRISIHALREEGDRGRTAGTASRHKFLSTPSARRATRGCGGLPLLCIFLSTPSARRATG